MKTLLNIYNIYLQKAVPSRSEGKKMNNRDMWIFIGGIAVGALGATLAIKHKEKIKPMAAGLMAKAIQLKEKAMDYAEKTKEHAEDIMAEAKHINESGTAAK